MCGIFCSLSTTCHVLPNEKLTNRLACRGPDTTGVVQFVCSISAAENSVWQPKRDVYVTLYSTVLSLRGDVTVQQPYRNESDNFTLCWNGEAWSHARNPVCGNDTEIVHGLLSTALVPSSEEQTLHQTPQDADTIAHAFSQLAGPYAFVFFDRQHEKLFFGRDFLGRRSLLTRTTVDGDLIISSLSDGDTQAGWTEVEADGISCIDLQRSGGAFDVSLAPYHLSNESCARIAFLQSVISTLSLNKEISHTRNLLDENSQSVTRLEALLRSSLVLRVLKIPDPPVSSNLGPGESTSTRLAILFSGGLDCTVLARLTHDLFPPTYPIDLLNVAFENPRVHKSAAQATKTPASIYELCPDRITGRASHAELQRICPNRAWRFIAIDIPYTEFTAHRNTIISLMHPHNTEMDLSIASALYFAARGKGHVSPVPTPTSPAQPYVTDARVLLSGLGADELFAGYTRHATAFKRGGLAGLLEELELDVARLGKRNLGRDDRVMSHWGKEVRYPYLDEELLSWALEVPVNEKCGFAESGLAPAVGDGSAALEPGKKVLRCLAWKLGMREVAREKKRAIQFGARTAKMETGKTKGTQLLS